MVEQTNIWIDLPRAFLLEQTLQTYKINGVVDHLKRYGDFGYAASLARCKRQDYTPLLLPEQVFTMVQGLDDFTWSLWSELCAINPEHYYIFSYAIDKAKFTIPSLSYALTIFRGELATTMTSVILQRQADQVAKDAKALVRSISTNTRDAWADIRDRL